MLDKLGPRSRATRILDYPAPVAHAGAPHQAWLPVPPFQRKVRKVGAPLVVLILLATVAGLIILGR